MPKHSSFDNSPFSSLSSSTSSIDQSIINQRIRSKSGGNGSGAMFLNRFRSKLVGSNAGNSCNQASSSHSLTSSSSSTMTMKTHKSVESMDQLLVGNPLQRIKLNKYNSRFKCPNNFRENILVPFSYEYEYKPYIFNWNIDDVSKCEQAMYKECTLPYKNEIKFELSFHPFGDSASSLEDGFTFIRARMANSDVEVDEAEFVISVIDSSGIRSISEENLIAKYDHNRFQTFAQLNICRSHLFAEQNGFISSDDRLTIQFDIYHKMKVPHMMETKRLQNDFRALLSSNDRFSDCIINVSGREFHLHKSVLAARSPIFASWFENDCSQNTNRITSLPMNSNEQARKYRLEIQDTTSEVFELLLKYIYTGEITMVDKNALELYSLSDKVKSLLTFTIELKFNLI